MTNKKRSLVRGCNQNQKKFKTKPNLQKRPAIAGRFALTNFLLILIGNVIKDSNATIHWK